jgi:hypothetical protein
MQQKQDQTWVQDNLLKVQLAEYSALRAEISSFHSIEHMSISFAIAAFSAVIALLIKTGVTLDDLLQSPASHKPDIALIASPFLFLGFFFGYSQIRIIQVAAYLNLRLRPHIVQFLGETALEWESYRRSLGMPMIDHFEDHAGYSGVMLGLPNEQVHVEFTHAEAGSPCPAPTRDNLLVIYMPDLRMYREALKHMRDQGHVPVVPENPYWKEKSETFEDPDGWRVVLYNEEALSGRA